MPHTTTREPPTRRAKPLRTAKRKRRLPLLPLLISLVVVLVIVNVAVIITRPDRPPVTSNLRAGAESPAGAGPTSRATKRTKARFGVFVGTDAKAAGQFETWLGRPVQDVVDFSNRESWASIANPAYLFDEWDGTRYRLIYAVPMLPDSLIASKESAMRRGATGAYNRYFTQLATRLVANGHQDAVLRIGWEFNITTWAWGIQDSRVYVAFFRHVVRAMRSVPGQRFVINWNPNNGYNPYDAVKYWPGNAFVDSVGVDAYDVDRNRYPYPKKCSKICREQRQQKAWDEVIYGGPRGLSFWSFFAQQHRKQFSLPEWSMWERFDGTGGGDNPFFLNQMAYFIGARANNVSFAAYFNRNSPDGRHDLLENFPIGAQRFRRLFGGRA